MKIGLYLSGMFLILIIFLGCPIAPPIIPGPEPVAGTTVLQFGEYVYQIGGEGDFGKKIYRFPIADLEQGKALDWIFTSELPEARAYTAVVAAGKRLYVIGGEDSDGKCASTIYRAYVFDDGTIGSWNTHGYSLPYGLSRMGYTAYDGRVFLSGGVKSDGSISDAILHARVSPNTFMGAWYESPLKLTQNSTQNTASIIGREDDNPLFVVSGGVGIAGAGLSSVDIFEVHDYGKLTEFDRIALPIAAISPVVFSSDAGLVFLNHETKYVYTLDNKSWSSSATNIAVKGGIGSFIVSNQLWVPSAFGQSEACQFEIYPAAVSSPVPFVFPGTGFVPKDSQITTHTMHGGSVLSSTDGSTWGPVATIGQTQKVYYKTQGQANDSFMASSSFTVANYGFMVNLSGYVDIQDQNVEAYVPITGSAGAILWYGIVVSDLTEVELNWKDGQSNPGDYNSSVKVSLLEVDLYNEVLDIEGEPIRERSVSDGLPVTFTLPSGQYYVQIHLESGTTCAIRLRRI